jgi:hypothetical protein
VTAHDFTGIALKLSRARYHRETLNSLIGVGVGEQELKLRSEHDPGQEGYNLYQDWKLSPALGVIVGDLFHNARSALDHLIAVLLTRNGRPVERYHAFPVFDGFVPFVEKVWRRSPNRGPGCLDGLVADERVEIRQLQPYVGRNPDQAARTPLSKLHACWNLDKHRLVHIGSTYAAGDDVHLNVGPPEEFFLSRVALFFGPGTVIPVNAKLAFVQIGVRPGTQPVKADIEFGMTVSVAFGEPGKLPVASLYDLGTMIDEVERIIRLFDPSFEVPDWGTVATLVAP